jgi:tyrosyl-tRNA synthetase
MTDSNAAAISELLTRSVKDIYPSREALRARLESGDKLHIYMGIDPTADYVHLGHSTNYLLLERFHRLGHRITVLVGDFTAKIGDPSDKSSARKQLTDAEVAENLVTFKAQIGKILDFEDTSNPIEFSFNSTWLKDLNFERLAELASNFTVQQMIERDAFQKRIAESKPLYVHEFFYPLMQGYDSVAMNVDLEVGGTDQTFNMMAGRTLVKRMQDREKFVITTTLLENPLTGEKLMSKSFGTGISLKEEPNSMYAKVMTLPDESIVQVYIDCTRVPMAAIEGLKASLIAGANPYDAKKSLARAIVEMYHGAPAALAAEAERERLVSEGWRPTEEDISIAHVTQAPLVDVLVAQGLATSKSEARRLIVQGGVRLDSIVMTLEDEPQFVTDQILQVGKRRYLKLKVT